MKEPPTNNIVLPPEAFPFVAGEADEEAAYDAYLTLPSLLEYRAKHQGEQLFLVDILGLQSPGPITFRQYTFAQVWNCVQHATNELGKSLPPRKPALTNTPGAIASLMRDCGAVDIVYHPDQLAVAEATASLLDSPGKMVPWWAIPSSDEAIRAPPATLRSQLSLEEASKSYACIHHSSGSTGNPKPIPCRQRAFMSQSVRYCEPGIVASPINHIYPRAVVLTAMAYAHPSWIFPHTCPLSPANFVRVMEAALPVARAIYVVTILLAPLLQHVDLLRQFDLVAVAGAPPPPAISDQLVNQGVKFAQIHGMSECGWLSTSFRDYTTNKDWQHVRPSPFCKDWVEFRPVGEDTYQLFLLPGMPHLHTSNCADGSYDTKDLWVRHPTDPDLWKYVSRTDEIIVHSNGLKTDPWPIEHKLNSAMSIVKDSLVVGADRAQPAVLILLAKPYQEAQEEICKLLEEVNAEIPTYSRIVPELIIPLDHGEDFVRSTKRTVIRPKSEKMFKDRVNAAYASYEGVGLGSAGKSISSETEALDLVHDVLLRVFPAYAKSDDHRDERDFFAIGMNSITATRVRNSLQKEVKVEHPLDQNVAFTYHTAAKLAHHIWNVSQGVQSNGHTGPSRMEETQEMLDKMKAAIRTPVPPKFEAGVDTDGRVILLTGATGGLGAHILHQIASTDEPVTVLCPVRADTDDHARERVEKSLAGRLLPPLDKLGKAATVFCFPADLESEDWIMKSYPPRFTRPDVVYHNAWPVNFNYTLSSFSPVISSIVNLINLFPLAHHIVISSIIAAHTHVRDGLVPEEIVPQPPEEMGIAYGRSKWIAERLADHAASLGARCTVVRVGQITGDSLHGVWTADEAPPIMIRSVAALHAMPDRAKAGAEVNWIPIDSAAWILATLGSANGEDQRRFELANLLAGGTMNWGIVLEEMKHAGMDFETLPYASWVERVKQAREKGESCPAEKLLHYLEDAMDDHQQPAFDMRNLRLILEETLQAQGMDVADANRKVASRLRGCDRELVRSMLGSWKSRGII